MKSIRFGICMFVVCLLTCLTMASCGSDEPEPPNGDNTENPGGDNGNEPGTPDNPKPGKDILDGKKFIYELESYKGFYLAMYFKDGKCTFYYFYTDNGTYKNNSKTENYSIDKDGNVNYSFNFRGVQTNRLSGYAKPIASEIIYKMVYDNKDPNGFHYDYNKPEKLKTHIFIEYYSDRTKNFTWEFNLSDKLPD